MKRSKYLDAPLLLPLLCIILVFAFLVPSDTPETHWSFMKRSIENMTYLRQQLLSEYEEAGLDGEAYAVVSAMTLGDKGSLTHELREVYSVTGASHILALSGLHLSIIYMLFTLLIPIRKWRIVTQALTIIGIWAFAFLTGLSPSITRAATMLTIYGLLSVGYREKMSINALAFTAILLLLISPSSLYNIGFQMSFLAVFGILLFMPLFECILPQHVLQRYSLLKWLWGLITVSISAQICVAPLIAFYFHRFSVYFLLSNFIVIPCAYIIIIGGLLLLLTHAALLVKLLTGTVSFMTQSLSTISSLPCASIENININVVQVMLIYVIITCVYIIFFVTLHPK